ncbi:hypothetical protein B5K11_20025 [Rhizobium leguminosarum bv. trifolii]|uniref:hypothetical protein n=1 Tax=Rhizobium leguminosarum TaxID=384 RepID=UPI000E2FC339|nr:hypothetical protein [Rhizobium leguminosarum]RFB90344.1 hypothetical protein B5K11_20025 [Rhizobium leguminosarum bv. trifolii]
MSSPTSITRLIGNLAALVGSVLVACFLLDLGIEWVGYEPIAFCAVLRPVIAVAYYVGVLLTAVGVIMWAVSMGKSEAGIALMLGGVMLFILPEVLPHYLGAECIPT